MNSNKYCFRKISMSGEYFHDLLTHFYYVCLYLLVIEYLNVFAWKHRSWPMINCWFPFVSSFVSSYSRGYGNVGYNYHAC